MTFLLVWFSVLFLAGAAVYGYVSEHVAAKLERRRNS